MRWIYLVMDTAIGQPVAAFDALDIAEALAKKSSRNETCEVVPLAVLCCDEILTVSSIAEGK